MRECVFGYGDFRMAISERKLLISSTLILAVFSACLFQIPRKEELISIDTSGQITLGNMHAPVHIILFEELACVQCKRFHEEDFPVIYERYIQTDKAKITTIPMAFLETSAIPFKTCICASKQEQTKSFLDFIFSLPQEKLLSSSAKELLEYYASNRSDFHLENALECIQSENVDTKIDQNRALITGDTIEMPTIIINGQRIRKIDIKEICNHIEKELRRAKV